MRSNTDPLTRPIVKPMHFWWIR